MPDKDKAKGVASFELEDVTLQFGNVTFVAEQPAVPTRTERDGNTTVNYVGTPEKPAYFEASYWIQADFKSEIGDYYNLFSWKVRLPAPEPATVPYAQVEAEGARLLAPMLRALADEVEKQVAEADKKASQAAGGDAS